MSLHEFRGANFPLAREARAVYRKALRDGLLVREVCEVCGNDDRGLTDGHHEDYAEPLNVRWLCRFHHRMRHDGAATIDEMIERREAHLADLAARTAA